MSNPTPQVTISDTGNCYINGSNAGQPADVIANNPALASAVGAALVAFVQQTVADANATAQAAQAAAAQAIEAAQAEAAAAKATADAATAALADAQAQIDALTAPSDATQPTAP